MSIFHCLHCDQTKDADYDEPRVDPEDPDFFICLNCQVEIGMCPEEITTYCTPMYTGRDEAGRKTWECRWCGNYMEAPK